MDPVWEVLFRAAIASYTNITQKSGELPKHSHSLMLLEMDIIFSQNIAENLQEVFQNCLFP